MPGFYVLKLAGKLDMIRRWLNIDFEIIMLKVTLNMKHFSDW